MRVLLCLLAAACAGDPELKAPFADDFERGEIGNDWKNTGGPYEIKGGKLSFQNAHNHPLWLKRRLPHDVRIDFDCTSYSPDGDLKVEFFGDGETFQSEEAVRKDEIYVASGYVAIFGGWRNSRSVLVRENEHEWQFQPGKAPIRMAPRVEPGKTYHWTLTRRGGRIEWMIDGQPFLQRDDPAPLAGKGHDHFGFNGWEAPVTFDNLRISPL
jgi:hypothetical protein